MRSNVNRLRIWLFVCLAAGFAPAGGVFAQTRIMPLGDSITQGGQGYVSFRYELWFDLQATGYVVDFVGGRDFTNNNDTPIPTIYPNYFTTFDRDHEGYWGWRTDEILSIVSAATSTAQPDIVLIHLGSNDVGQMGAGGVTNADANLRAIIPAIRAIRPNVVILLAQIIPIGPGTSYFANAEQIVSLNNAIAAIAADLNTRASPVVLIDQHTPFNLGRMMQGDGLHPNELGEAQMASVWQAALTAFLTPGNPPPTVTITSPMIGASFVAPANLAVTAAAQDANGFVDSVSFFANGNPIGSDGDEPFEASWSNVGVGTYQLTAVATDDAGATGNSSPVTVTVTPPGAHNVPITNASFEVPVLGDGALAEGPGVIGGWTFSGTANTYTGVFNPPSGSYPSAGGSSTPTGANGVNAAYLFNNGGPAESISCTQMLSETLQADAMYTLTVAIGKFLLDQPYDFSTYGGYRIELLAGSTVVAFDQDSVDPAFGSFQDAAATVATNQVDPMLIGLPLSIRLNISATSVDRSTHFDYVRLVRSSLSDSVPAVGRWGAALVMLTIGVAGTTLARRATRASSRRTVTESGRRMTHSSEPGVRRRRTTGSTRA